MPRGGQAEVHVAEDGGTAGGVLVKLGTQGTADFSRYFSMFKDESSYNSFR
jgi:hypothetical protein